MLVLRMTVPYAFRPVTEADKIQLYAWLKVPHVARWWVEDGEDPFTEDIPTGGDLRQWIVRFGSRDIAYVQDYLVHAWRDHPFAFLVPGARGVDMFIGPADMIGRGHGSALVRAHALRLIGEGAPAVGIDPHPDNRRAVRAYQKAGFRILDGARDSAWGRFVPMVLDASDLA